MLTPQEVSQHAFAKASFGGYNMAMVDEFLDQLTEDYTALYKENAVLKSKMKVLVDKVEEYRSTEDGMRKAILVAQKAGDQILVEAKEERAKLLNQAETEARAKIAAMRKDADNEQVRLLAAKNATNEYVAALRELCQRELDFLGGISHVTAPVPSAADTAARDIEASVRAMVEEVRAPEQAPEPVPAPPAVDEAESEDVEYTVSFDEEPEFLSDLKGDGSLYAELLELNLTPGKREAKPEPPHEEGHHAARRYEEDHPTPPEEENEDDDEPTRRIDFDNLKFGKDIKF